MQAWLGIRRYVNMNLCVYKYFLFFVCIHCVVPRSTNSGHTERHKNEHKLITLFGLINGDPSKPQAHLELPRIHDLLMAHAAAISLACHSSCVHFSLGDGREKSGNTLLSVVLLHLFRPIIWISDLSQHSQDSFPPKNLLWVWLTHTRLPAQQPTLAVGSVGSMVRIPCWA